MGNAIRRPALGFVVALLAAFLVAGESQAALIVTYGFSGTGGDPYDPATDSGKTVAANVAASDFLVGAGLVSPNVIVGGGNPDPGVAPRADLTEDTAAEAISNDDYLYFTVDADAGYELDLTDLAFDLSRGSQSFTTNVFVRSSLDSYAANLDITGDPDDVATTSSNSWATITVDLSGASFQDLQGEVEFRLYVYDDDNRKNRYTRLDNVTVNGDVVPEPATMSLLGLGFAGIAVIRRRR